MRVIGVVHYTRKWDGLPHVLIHRQQLVARFILNSTEQCRPLRRWAVAIMFLASLVAPTKVDEKPRRRRHPTQNYLYPCCPLLIAAAVCLTFHLLHLSSHFHSNNPPPFFLLSHTVYPPHTITIMSVSTVETKPFQDQKPGT